MSLTTSHHYEKCVTEVNWRIDNLSTHRSNQDPNYCLKSDVFNLYKSRLQFQLEFRPILPEGNLDNDFTAVSLIPYNLDNQRRINLKCKICVNNEDVVNEIEYMWSINDQKKGEYTCSKSVKREVLFSKMNEEIFYKITAGSINIHCEIERREIFCVGNFFKFEDRVDLEMFEFHQSNENSMCKIQVDNEVVNVDKSILTSNSDVFASMLDAKFEEGQSNVIKISDFKPAILKKFFKCIYAGYVLDASIANELIVLAEKYNVKWMKKECEIILGYRLSMNNIFECLNLATTHNCSLLKEYTLYFTSSKAHFKEIIKTSEWNEFALENKEFSNKILTKGLKDLYHWQTSTIEFIES